MNRFLGRTQEMVEACGANVAVEQNPGAVLGIILGTAARNGRDKLTIITSPGIPPWARGSSSWWPNPPASRARASSQSTAKTLGAPDVYGNDRVFAYVRLESAPDKAQDAKVAALEQAGHPVVRISVGRHLRSGPGIFPLGDRYRRGRFHHRHQRLQPARR